MDIRTKQFQIMTDIDLVWGLMTDVYHPSLRNGPAAPFFEYALINSWFDKDYLRLNRIWLDGSLPVAFVFYENPVTTTYFVLRPGYEFLAGEMIEYADSAYPRFEEPREFILMLGQTALLEAALDRGYEWAYQRFDRIFLFDRGRLDHPLPEGYEFIDAGKADPLKSAKCLWDGFNSEEFGEFKGWDIPTKNGGLSPHELYQNVLCATISPSPHSTYEHTVIIADRNGDYVCFSGMWWVPENRLAYMEPLCTVPSHRNRGLAAAALSRHFKVMSELGAEVMTGGGGDFYKRIGYQATILKLHLKKRQTV